MIAGTVNARREAVIGFRVRGPSGVESSVEAIIDTGFSGSLTLPSAVISTLGLVRVSTSHAILADGSDCPFNVFEVEVEWAPAGVRFWCRRSGRRFLPGCGCSPITSCESPLPQGVPCR